MILGVLKFDSTGPPYFNFKDDGSLVWPEGAEIMDVRVDSSVYAYRNRSLTISGQSKEQVWDCFFFYESCEHYFRDSCFVANVCR